MRRVIFLVATLFLVLNIEAQMPRWVLHPHYSSIEMLGNGYYVVSENGKYGMMDSKEKVVVKMLYDRITPFHSHTALLYDQGDYVGYISDQGRVKLFSPQHYEIVGKPQFQEGYLLVRNSIGYYYLRASDDEVIGPFSGGTNFCEGYAVVNVPKSQKKILDGDYTIQALSAKTGQTENLNLGEYNVDDIDFMSSSSNGKCIIVLKKRVHEYNFKTSTLTPIHYDGNLENKKSRVTANERPVNIFSDDKGFFIQLKQGKMGFDSLMRLNVIEFEGQEQQRIAVPQQKEVVRQSPIKSLSFPNNDLLGLAYGDKRILSPQFEKVTAAWNDEAIVTKNGKYGVVGIAPNSNCQFMLNDNLAIGFEHKTVNTTIKAVCPPSMNPQLMTLTSQDENCHINTDTRKESTNVETAVLTYQCTLDIPEEIALEKSSANTKLSLNYDGLKMIPTLIPFDTWFVNNYNVSIMKQAIEGSVLNIEVLVTNNSKSGKSFFREVAIEAEDSVTCKLTKINEEMYSARFYGWKEDATLRFSVNITEDGCPTLSYDRSITLNTGKKSQEKAEEPEAPVATAKIKRKAKPKTTVKKEKQDIFF